MLGGGFFGATASGVWLGLIAASLTGFFATFTLWEDMLALIVLALIAASGAVLGLTIVVGKIEGRHVVFSLLLTTGFAALNVLAVLYLFGK